MMAAGLAVVSLGQRQQSMPLRAALDTALPVTIDGQVGQDLAISREEQEIAGMSDYVVRVYGDEKEASGDAFSVYVGYYENQTQGRTIHSPRNCLPGAGWEALTSSEESVNTPTGIIPVNFYVLQNGSERAVALYWYQGRGRVVANEYRVKWNLLLDRMVRRRSDEALVRILVPVVEGETDQLAFQKASRLVGTLMPAVSEALPL